MVCPIIDLMELMGIWPAFSPKIFSTASDSRVGKILSRELRPGREPMIHNGAYLIKDNKLNMFRKKVRKWERSNQAYIIEMTGPWPPYNFV